MMLVNILIAWYTVPYKRDRRRGVSNFFPARYCAMDDFAGEIISEDNGEWSSIEIAGNQAIVKVKASKQTLDKLDKIFNRLVRCPSEAFFIANPRRKPRYDAKTDTIFLDGCIQQTKSIMALNREVAL